MNALIHSRHHYVFAIILIMNNWFIYRMPLSVM